jgi:periplasmic mercuric ion binding protein
MKNLITIVSVLVLSFVAFTTNAQDKKKDSKLAEVTFVTSIDCPGCVKKLEDNLPFEKGVKDLKINLETKTVWFKYQTNKTSIDKLKMAIEKNGYKAEEKK